MRPRKLDGRLDSLAPRRAEESLPQSSASPFTELIGQFPGKVRDMTLDHRWAAPLKFSLQCAHNVRMVVSYIVHAVSREKVDDATTVGRKQFRPNTPLILHVHLEQVEEAHPLRIYPFRIAIAGTCLR
jgi:hypothetical protein